MQASPSPEGARLHPSAGRPASIGREMLSPEIVDAYKRERVVIAIAELARDYGLGEVTTAMIVSRARIGRKKLYELFPTKEEAFHAACMEAASRLAGAVSLAGAEGTSRSERARRAIDALVAEALRQPALTELALTHSLAADPERPDRFLEIVVAALAQAIGEDQIAELGARSVVSMVSMQLMRGQTDLLLEMRGGLAGLVGA